MAFSSTKIFLARRVRAKKEDSIVLGTDCRVLKVQIVNGKYVAWTIQTVSQVIGRFFFV